MSNVSGGTGPYSYQWYLNGIPVSGATSATWTFTPTTVSFYTVYVNVTDSVGSEAISTTANIISIYLAGPFYFSQSGFTVEYWLVQFPGTHAERVVSNP
jgi:hypothetical protein